MIRAVFVGVLLLIGVGCRTQHEVETTSAVEVKPIHITLDINLKIDNELDDFFGDIDQAATEPAATEEVTAEETTTEE